MVDGILTKTTNAEKIWAEALLELKRTVSRANYTTWLQDTVGIGCEDKTTPEGEKIKAFTIRVPTRYVADRLKGRLYSVVCRTLSAIFGIQVEVIFEVGSLTVGQEQYSQTADTGNEEESSQGNSQMSLPGMRFQVLPPGLRNKTFVSIIMGTCNENAIGRMKDLITNPERNDILPLLYLWGRQGTGKTHLTVATQMKIPGSRYIAAEQFIRDYTLSCRQKTHDEFWDTYCAATVLLVDDIALLEGREGTQLVLTKLINEFARLGKHIVITATCLPEDLNLLPNLVSRLQGADTEYLDKPDRTTRLNFLLYKQETMAIDTPKLKEVSRSTWESLADVEVGSMREVERIFAGIEKHCRYKQKAPSMSVAIEIVAKFIVEKRRGDLSNPTNLFDAICRQTAIFYGIRDENDILNGKRGKEVDSAKKVVAYLARKKCNLTLQDIGNKFRGPDGKGKDHSTIISACKGVAQSPNLLSDANQIWTLITGQQGSCAKQE